MKILLYEEQNSVIVQNLEHLDRTIYDAAENVRNENFLSCIFLLDDNENELGIVVGGDETVLSFNYNGKDGPYFASKGESDNTEPVMTCYAYFIHHTEFPRKYVIPFKDGLNAAHEFYLTGDLPKCIAWIEV